MTAQTYDYDREQDDLDLAFETVKDLEADDPESIQGGLRPPALGTATCNPSGG